MKRSRLLGRMLARRDADGAGGLLAQIAQAGQFGVNLDEARSHGAEQRPPSFAAARVKLRSPATATKAERSPRLARPIHEIPS